MNCPSCNTEMKRRDGKFGEFLFCPDQHVCGQSTISLVDNPLKSFTEVENHLRRDSLMSELLIMYERQMDIFKDNPYQEQYYDSSGEPTTVIGDSIYNDPDWYRPY